MKVQENDSQFVERLNQYPKLRERMKLSLNIVEKGR